MKFEVLIKPDSEEKVYKLFLTPGPNCMYLKVKAPDGYEWFILSINNDGTFARCGGLCINEFKRDKELKIIEIEQEA